MDAEKTIQRTGTLRVTRTYTILDEARVLTDDEVTWTERHLRETLGRQLGMVLSDGRHYDVCITIITIKPTDIYASLVSPTLATFPHHTSRPYYNDYYSTCTATVVLVDPSTAEIGEIVRTDSLPFPTDTDLPPFANKRTLRGLEGHPSMVFMRHQLGWERVE